MEKTGSNIIIDTEDFDIIILSWLNYIDTIYVNKYLYSVSDAPTQLTKDELLNPMRNKNILINKYLDDDQASNADNLLVYLTKYTKGK